MPDPFGREPGARLYRTGDLTRQQIGCGVEFVGRLDHQIKIRGFRIEPREIEAVLLEHPQVREAVVCAHTDTHLESCLAAYVVAADGSTVEAEALREHLLAKLPEPMIPAFFVTLAALPLTANGKIDRGALPAPEGSAYRRRQPYVAARNSVEAQLVSIWKELLGQERIGIHDNFFDLGGHSLLAARMIARIGKIFRVTLPLRTVFAAPVLQTLAQAIGQAMQTGDRMMEIPAIQRMARNGRIPLSFAQQRLWFFHRLAPRSSAYNVPSALAITGSS